MQKTSASSNPSASLGRLWLFLLFVAGLFGAVSAQAASQTWTNAPADASWANTNNWVGQGVPGAFVPGGSTQNRDMCTFNAPLASGIGGDGNPITMDIFGTTNREVGAFLFDTANCGAYTIGAPGGNNLLLTAAVSNIAIGSNVTMTASVVNPIKFYGPVRFHYVSSANGGFQFTNNAASANATLFFNTITNDSASSRPLTLILAGSNTGTNTIAHFDDNAGANGAIHLVKEGTGRWILSGWNDFPNRVSAGDNIRGSVSVNHGTLEVKDPGSLGAIIVGSLNVGTAGTLLIDGVTLNNNGITLTNGGTIQMNGTGTNLIAVGTHAGTSVTLATTSASDVWLVTATNGGAADSVVHVAGPGTVLLNSAGASSYPGKWSADAGTCAITNATALGSGPNLNINAGGTFDVSPLGALTYTLTTTALSASGTGTTVGSTAAAIKADSAATVALGSKPIAMTFSPTSFTGDTTHPPIYVSQGTLSLGGNTITVNNASGTPLGAGTYRLIQQASGSLTSGGSYAVVVTGSGMATLGVGQIVVSGGNLDLVVTIYVPQPLVWTGGNPNSTWDVNNNPNFLNGLVHSVFNTADDVTFDAVGSTNPTVTLSGTLAPTSLTVDTSANNYTFTGSGSIAGSTALLKKSAGTLVLQTANSYLGGTVISNGTLKVGINNAVSSSGAGDVTIHSPGILDLNTFSNNINGLIGDGTVDNTGGGASTLMIGLNNDGGTFTGVIQNSSGTLGLIKAGNGLETLSQGNTYTGPTTINVGTLRVLNYNSLGSGASAVTVNGGTLDMNSSLVVDSLQGGGGTIANVVGTGTNTLVIKNVSTATSTYGGVIADGASGRIAVLVTNGTVRFNGANTYSGGTIVGSGATLAIGNGSPLPQAGTGGIILSNNATLALPGVITGAAAPGNTITTVDGATAYFTSANTQNGFSGDFIGSANTTNVFNGTMTLNDRTTDFSNFLGTVIFTNAGTRLYGSTMGSDQTTFILAASGGINGRNGPMTVHLGSLEGSGTIGAPSQTAATVTYVIGGNNKDTVFSGQIQNALPTTNNAITKIGTGRLTLNGGTYSVLGIDPDTLEVVTNVYYTNLLTYIGWTVVSNGVLELDAPAQVTNSLAVILSTPTAVIDAANMGYIATADGTNVVTNGVFEVVSGQSLNGVGTIRGTVQADLGSILNPGNTTPVLTNRGLGVLTITNVASLAGAVQMRLNLTNNVTAATNDELVAHSITVAGTASLLVTNQGPEAYGVFQLFNHPVTFATVVLPTLTGTNVWVNDLAANGSITLLAPALVTVITSPAPVLTNSFDAVSGQLTLNWGTGYKGYRLQAQTNSAAVGFSNNWVDITGSTGTNKMIISIDTLKGTVFYRLLYP